jgi:tetratricopeptide (TPR) repeat protein
MPSKRLHTSIAITLILLGFAASVGLTRYLENRRPPLPRGFEDQDLGLQASKMKGFVFGAEGLIADWYWMNSLQYVGRKISAVGLDKLNLDDLSSLNPRLLYPYLNNTVELDPRFIPAYSYGAIVLPAINVDDAIALTEKGIANNPNEWRLYQYLGYIYWKKKDYEKAAEVYSQAAQIPGVPVFIPMMAASMKSRGGDRETARAMYQGMLAEADSDSTRNSIELRLLEIDSLDERDAMNDALDELVRTNGKCPPRLSEIIPKLRAAKLPRDRSFSITNANELADPAGFLYRLDKYTCRAELAYDSRIPKAPQ